MTAPAPVRSSAPRSATLPRRIAAQSWFETVSVLRNGEQLLVAIVLPALALVGLTSGVVPGFAGPERLDLAMAGVFGLAVVSTSFTGQAIATGFDRRYGVLRLLGTTPLGRGGLIAAKGIASVVVLAVQVTVLSVVGLALGWRPTPLPLVAALPVAVLGVGVFVSLALLLAGTVRAEAVLALANLLWVLVLALGGLVVPHHALPGGLAAVVPWLPSGALGDGMRSALVHGRVDLPALGILVLWGVLAAVAARRFFRWSD